MGAARFAQEGRDAAEIAEQAGKLLLEIQKRTPNGDTRGAEGDRSANTFILDELRRRYPGDAILSEESPDDTARLAAERLWIVDPLDGTREFSEGRHDWGVHVAFVHRSELAAGAVALPARGLTLSTATIEPGQGTLAEKPRIAVSRSRAPEIAHEVARALNAELVPIGSAGYKAMSVVLGEAEAYIHAGGQYEWDAAAPAAVATAAGLHVSRIDGNPLKFNQERPWTPDLLICDPRLTRRILELLKS